MEFIKILFLSGEKLADHLSSNTIDVVGGGGGGDNLFD